MKPPSFRYHAPTTTAEALDALAGAAAGGKVLAGGQSLIPLLNMRLASPGHLVDIARVTELDGVTVSERGVRVGAGARQAAVERHKGARATCPLLAEALGLVAHPVIRNRGTVCGSVAHADPAAELPAVLAVLGGTVHTAVKAAGGVRRRDIGAREFFVAPLESCLEPGALVEAVTFPALPAAGGAAIVEVTRRHGDYAVCGVAATVTLDGSSVASARLALFGVGPVPEVVALDERLAGAPMGRHAWSAAAAEVQRLIAPADDVHAGADYRRHLAGVLTRKALATAVARAVGRGAASAQGTGQGSAA